MKKLICLLSAALIFQYNSSAQEISTDKMLDLIGKTVNDPAFRQIRTQEDMLTDAWNRGFSLYFSIRNDTINSISFKNGEKRYQKEERYGVYSKTLPAGLNWSMTSTDLMIKLGVPVRGNFEPGTKYYSVGDKEMAADLENGKVVSLTFYKKPVRPNYTAADIINKEILNADTLSGKVTVNWPALRQVLISTANLKPLTGKDSVDYIGQVYYSTPYKATGFERSAIKRIKSSKQWYYEAFIKTYADTNQVKRLFINLYQTLKNTMSQNSDDDFTPVAIAKDPLSNKTVSWMAAWTLYKDYKTLPKGLPKLRMTLMLSKMLNVFKNDAPEYTIKLYIGDPELSYDIFTWDKPE